MRNEREGFLMKGKMKKWVATLTVVALMVLSMATLVFADPGNGGGGGPCPFC